jgi:5'-3' exonuclease
MRRLIIDGNNLVHRAFWIASNQPIFNEHFHVHLFLTSVKNYVTRYQADVVYCTWDEKVDFQVNKRKELLEEYKGNRDQERNKAVHSKNHIIKELLEYLGIKNVLPRAYEADDVMAIFNYLYPEDERIIITVDKDMCQLIGENTVVYDPIRKVEFNTKNFEELIGYELKDFVKLKALTGDKSDNIPGIKGFGKVKIAKFLNGEYHMSVEEKIQFENNLKLVDLSITLQDQDEVEYVKAQFEAKPEINFDAFKQKCDELYFHKILNSIDSWYGTFFMRSKLADLLNF